MILLNSRVNLIHIFSGACMTHVGNESCITNKKRLPMLLGLLSLLGMTVHYVGFSVRTLTGIVPLLFITAICPTMCAVGGIVSCVKGRKIRPRREQLGR